MNEGATGLLNYFYRSREASRSAAEKEKTLAAKNGQPWDTYNTPLSGYSDFFTQILDEEPLHNFLERRKRNLGHVFTKE